MEKPKISIIVPIYNVDIYIEKCIDSILSQSYDNIEVILVDDGSTDRSAAICDAYMNKDDRIIVIHKPNGGLSDARNSGLDICSGDYISFVDADDFISRFFLEIMYYNITKYQADIATVTFASDFWDGECEHDVKLAKSPNDFFAYSLSPSEALAQMLYQKIPSGVPYRLYKRPIFETIRFPKGFLYEDLATVYKTFIKAEKITVIDSYLYAYRHRKSSIIRQKFTKKKMVCIPIANQIYSDICRYNSYLKPAVASRVFAFIYSVYLQVPRNDHKNRDLLWNELLKYQKIVLRDRDKRLRKKNKFAAIAMFFGKDCAYYAGRKFGQKGSMYQ